MESKLLDIVTNALPIIAITGDEDTDAQIRQGVIDDMEISTDEVWTDVPAGPCDINPSDRCVGWTASVTFGSHFAIDIQCRDSELTVSGLDTTLDGSDYAPAEQLAYLMALKVRNISSEIQAAVEATVSA